MALYPCTNPKCPDKRKNPNNSHRVPMCPYEKSTTGTQGEVRTPLLPTSTSAEATIEALRAQLGDSGFKGYVIDRLKRELDEGALTPTEADALKVTLSISDQLDEEDIDSAAEIFHSQFPKTEDGSSRLGTLQYLTEDMVIEKILADVGEPAVKKTGRNGRIAGLSQATKGVVDDYNYSEMFETNYEFKKDPEEFLDYSIDRARAGVNREKELAALVGSYGFDDGVGRHLDEYPDHEKLTSLLSLNGANFNQQLYLSTVFPHNELKDEMDRLDITGVSATPVLNGRENGIAYTALTPEGNTRTFFVYEHRNTDSIIVNGKENWDGDGLPYAGDDSHTYFAEFSPNEFGVVADTLSFYLKSAQEGTLPSDQSLTQSVNRRDWLSVYRRRVPALYEMIRRNNPEIDRQEQEREARARRGEPDNFWDIVNPL